MFPNKLNFLPFFAPVTPIGGGGPSGELTGHDIFKILDDDSDKEETLDLKEEKPKTEDKKEEKKEEIKEEKEIEDEDEEEKEEKEEKEVKAEDEEDDDEIPEEGLELITPVRRSEILKEYPDLFKKFPYLNSAYYREQEFTKYFADPEDAKVALDAKNVLDQFENDLSKGDVSKVFESIKKTDENVFHHLVDNLFDTIKNVDEKSYNHMVGTVIKSTILAMAREAKSGDDKDLVAAAKALQKFVFGTTDFEMPGKLAKEEIKKDETDKIAQKEKEFLQRRFTTASNDLTTRVDKVLYATVQANIDPNDTLPPFVKKHAIREVVDAVTDAIKRDARFKANLDRLWEAALKEEFSDGSVKKLKDAYLNKAKGLLPLAIKNKRIEASKGLVRKSKEKEEEVEVEDTEDTTEETRTSHPRKETQQRRSREESSKGKPAGMSTREFLMRD